MNVTWPYNSSGTRSGWTRTTGGSGCIDAIRSEEAIHYELSPLAHLQWHATVDWAEEHGRCEVALHGVGDPATRRVCYFACGRQRVSGAFCETLASGVDEIARAAAAAGLRMLGQVHHHPSSIQHRAADVPPRFFLSSTDMILLEALARDLTSGVMLFEPAYRAGSVVLRAGGRTQLQAEDRRFELAVGPGTRLMISGAEMESLRAVAQVFVAVTGSDGNLHGKVLQTEVCAECGTQTRRSLHPLNLRVTGNFEPQYLGRAFDAQAWAEELDEQVRRYHYRSGTRAPRHGGRWGRPAAPARAVARKTARTSARPQAADGIGERLTQSLEMLESVVDSADDRVAGALEELRALAEDVAALTAAAPAGREPAAADGGDELGCHG